MSDASADARRFVAEHREIAIELGARLAGLIDEPDVFVAALKEGLVSLMDPEYTTMAERVSPDVSAELVVRSPLVDAVQRPLRAALNEGSSASALWLAQRLAEEESRDIRLFALPCLRRSLGEDPEQSWQLMRRLGRRAGDWIEVDSLADPWARGVLAEPFRWAELEQLVYSRLTFERRLVGATLATIPHRVPTVRRGELRGEASAKAYQMIGLLMGDAQTMVQKSLSWAIREWTRVDAAGAASLLRDETSIAADRTDGARAWVIRDSLSSQPAELAVEVRARLGGIRRDSAAPSTSIAASQTATFAAALDGTNDAVAQQGHRYTRSRA